MPVNILSYFEIVGKNMFIFLVKKIVSLNIIFNEFLFRVYLYFK